MSSSLWTKAESFEPRNITPAAALTRGFNGIMDRLAREIRRRRTYANLARLDDCTLKDIGLDRGMLPGVADRTSRNPARERRLIWAESRSQFRIRERGAKLLSCFVDIVFEARKRAAARDLRRLKRAWGRTSSKNSASASMTCRSVGRTSRVSAATL